MRHRAGKASTSTRRRRARRAALAVCACACLWWTSAQAQVSGSVGVVSDYRYRGHSLSDGDPAVQASVGYDAASGVYGGLFGSTTRYAGDPGSQWIPYVGFARRDRQGRSWDVGVRYVHFTRDATYAEAHVGVAFERLALRLHYAPDYYDAVGNAYFEADFAFPLGERVRLLLHGGVSRSGSQSPPQPTYRHGYGDGDYDGYDGYDPAPDADGGTDRTRLDISAGLLVPTRLCEVQAIWHHVDGSGASYAGLWNPNDRTGWVLGCVRRW